eukprot:403355850
MNVIQVAAGNEHTLILTDCGDVYSGGYNEMGNSLSQGPNAMSQNNNNNNTRTGQLKLVEKLRGKNIVKIFASNGCEHVIALTNNGKVFSFGFNVKGQLGHGDQTSINSPKQVEALSRKFVTAVGCSYYHTIFSCADEMEIYSCGRNDYGQLGLGNLDDKNSPTLIEALNGKRIVSIGCGQYHSVVSSIDGEIFSFGRNDSGQLGITGSDGNISLPKEVKNLKSTQIACGYYHTVAINNGQLYSWGKNDSGQLGIGIYSAKEILPTLVRDLEDQEIVSVACGCYHTLALGYAGQLFSFGRNSHGQLGDGTTNNSCKPLLIQGLIDKKVCQIAAGFYHSIVLANPVIRNPLVEDFKQLLNNQELSDVTFIVEGKKLYAHRCILMARCEPLERMVNGHMREAFDLQIQIEDTSYQCFYSLLEYLYTEQVEALNQFETDIMTKNYCSMSQIYINFALDLLSLADQYLVEQLKRKCEEAIQKSIKIDDVCLMLNIAISRGANSLKKRCLQFMMSNFSKIIVLDQFVELPKHVLKEVFKMANRKGVFVRELL